MEHDDEYFAELLNDVSQEALEIELDEVNTEIHRIDYVFEGLAQTSP